MIYLGKDKEDKVKNETEKLRILVIVVVCLNHSDELVTAFDDTKERNKQTISPDIDSDDVSILSFLKVLIHANYINIRVSYVGMVELGSLYRK